MDSSEPKPPGVHNERERKRLAALHNYSVLDTAAEPVFDQTVELAAEICGTPMALITFLDETREWTKAAWGLPRSELPRERSFGLATCRRRELVVIPDTLPDYAAYALVQGPPHIRFYAATPLTSPDGDALGTLCVLDVRCRDLSAPQLRALRFLGNQVLAHLELRRREQQLLRTVDEQKRAREALRNSDAFYHSLVESLPQNIFRKDVQGRFTFANRRFCASLGKPLSEIIGRTDHDIFPETLAEKYQQDDRQVIERGLVIDTVEAHQTARHGQRFVQVIKTPLYDHAGNIVGVQGIFWDVTERKRIEELWSRERNLLRSLFDNVPDIIYFKDEKSRYVRISKFMAERFGLRDPQEALGKSDFDFFASDHAQAAFEDEQRILLTGAPMIGKTEKELWADGRESWVLTTKIPLRDTNGRVMGTLGISRDITRLKEVEKAMAEARDSAVQSARLKSEFLANMSHEIRTPMNAIIGMSGLLLDTELTGEQKDFANTIYTSADSLLAIINDILDFSKIEAGKLKFETIDFDLRDTVESVIETFAESAQQKGIEIAVWFHDEVPLHLRGDPGRLRQILMNLVGNAVKFTPQGEVLLEIERLADPAEKPQLRFTVRDTGIGIPAGALEFLFQPFTQADGSMTRKYGGSGLGLAISKQLVELLGGNIGVQSTPDLGSQFTFTLPLEQQTDLVRPGTTRERRSLYGLHVLIVDDNATNRRILHHQILSGKMRNGSAANAAEAMELLRSAAALGDPYEVVLTDMQMPETDGLTLARQIQADPAAHNAEIVLLTSMGQRFTAEQLQAAGVAACLVKPVKQSRLLDTLANVMAHKLLAPDPADISGDPAGGETESEVLDPRRVLVAEDNRVNQKVTLKQLKKLGFKANAVANGLEVLHSLKQIPYDIIFMDCQMPELDGYEATRRIRDLETAGGQFASSRPHYIIAMTANALDGAREKCLAAGMNEYVTKPVRLPELSRALQRAPGRLAGENPTPPLSSDSDIVNLAMIQSFRQLDVHSHEDTASELIGLFLRDSSERFANLERALETRDVKQVQALAHAFKGSAANFGVDRVSDACAQLEKLASAGDLGQCRPVLELIKTEYARAEPILRQHLRTKDQ